MANSDALPPADVGALPPAGATPVLKRRMSELLALPMPVDVGVSVTVSQLRDVCVVEQRFYVDIRIAVTWIDARAQHWVARTKESAGELYPYWIPQLLLVNGDHGDPLANRQGGSSAS